MRDDDPLFRPIALARPELDTPSAWSDLIPLGMTLVDFVRPRLLVELGTKNGISYCAFCQAVVALGLDTRCLAVDTWEGDATTTIHDGDQMLASLREHHDPRYGSFSTLLRMTFDEALGRVEDGSVDLLHIDGWHAYEAVRHDFETWLPKLSDRGVVLLHDVMVRTDGFGVGRFWEELEARYPTFRIEHGAGLGIAAVGIDAPALLPMLTASATDALNFRSLMADLGAARRVPGPEQKVEKLRLKLDGRAQSRATRSGVHTPTLSARRLLSRARQLIAHARGRTT